MCNGDKWRTVQRVCIPAAPVLSYNEAPYRVCSGSLLFSKRKKKKKTHRHSAKQLPSLHAHVCAVRAFKFFGAQQDLNDHVALSLCKLDGIHVTEREK